MARPPAPEASVDDVAAAPAPADGDAAAPVVAAERTFVSLVGDTSGAADADAAAADIEPTLWGEPNEHGLLRDHKKGMPITRCMACKRCHRLPASIFITTLFPTFTRRFHAGNLITHMYDTGESTTGWWKRSTTSAFTRADTAYCTPCGPKS